MLENEPQTQRTDERRRVRFSKSVKIRAIRVIRVLGHDGGAVSKPVTGIVELCRRPLFPVDNKPIYLKMDNTPSRPTKSGQSC
ncbi:MAG: hypothetical protein O8C61_08445 [Candidatus Methanoperedens sp.]|nr:hypothetical protein [Candidatus Methanoperedens sp.]